MRIIYIAYTHICVYTNTHASNLIHSAGGTLKLTVKFIHFNAIFNKNDSKMKMIPITFAVLSLLFVAFGENQEPSHNHETRHSHETGHNRETNGHDTSHEDFSLIHSFGQFHYKGI